MNEQKLHDIYSPQSKCLITTYIYTTVFKNFTSSQPHLMRGGTPGTTAATKFVTDQNVNITKVYQGQMKISALIGNQTRDLSVERQACYIV